MKSSKDPHNGGRGKGDHIPDHDSERDFADFLAGSRRADHESTLPLPEDQGRNRHSTDTTSTQNEDSDAESVNVDGAAPTIPEGMSDNKDDDEQQTGGKNKLAEKLSEKSREFHKKHPHLHDGSLDKYTSLDEAEDLNPEVRDRAEVLGTSVRWFAGWCLRLLIIALAAYVASKAFGQLWVGILPVLLALIVCTVLWPVVRVLREKLHFPNALAVATTIIGFFVVIAGLFALIIPPAVDQSRELATQANAGIRTIQRWLQGPPVNLQESQFNDALNQATNWLQNQSGRIASEVAAGASATLSALMTLFIMLVLTFFFLKDGEKFLPMIRRITGRRVGWHLTEALTRCWQTLGGFIRTQALVSFIDAVFIGGGLFLMGVPLAGPLAVLTFFAGFIPIVGATVAGVLSVLIALVGVGFKTAIFTLILVLAVQQLEGNVLSPWLQAKAMNLHPVIVLLAVTLGGTLFGIIGAFLAVPAAAMIAVILRYMGDLTDLATGEKSMEDIEFATTAGSLSGAQSQRKAEQWLAGQRDAMKATKEKLTFSNLLNPLRKGDK